MGNFKMGPTDEQFCDFEFNARRRIHPPDQ